MALNANAPLLCNDPMMRAKIIGNRSDVILFITATASRKLQSERHSVSIVQAPNASAFATYRSRDGNTGPTDMMSADIQLEHADSR